MSTCRGGDTPACIAQASASSGKQQAVWSMAFTQGLLELTMASTIRINGIGTASPGTTFTSEEGLRVARMANSSLSDSELSKLYKDVRIDSRSLVLDPEEMQERILEPVRARGQSTRQRLEHYNPAAVALAHRSANIALDRSDRDPGSVTHLVTVSCTGVESPGAWLGVHQALGLRDDVSRTHIGFMGCHGAMNGLAAARAFAAEDSSNVVLLICMEICSIHYHVGSEFRDQAIANALFADGAASVIISQVNQGPVLDCFSSRLFPDTSELMTWRVGDNGFEMRLSPRVPIVLKRAVSSWIGQWLEESGLSIEDIGSWAIHPGGRDIVEGVRQGLGLSQDQMAPSLELLAKQGNMSSSTVLWIIKRLIDDGCRGSMVAMAFGPGLVGESVLLIDK